MASTAWVPDGNRGRDTAMRYGMNPHQRASIVAGHGPRVVNGAPSMINYLDALNAFELVREADDATGRPAAASFKHVSPAGAALAGAVDATAARLWRVDQVEDGGLLSAYVRARDADPKSSFGDVVALSRPVDLATAEFLRTVIADAVIAPGFEPGAVAVLAAKRDGRFLVLEADRYAVPSPTERREVLGVTIEQDRDAVPVDRALPDDAALDPAARADALLGLAGRELTAGQRAEFEELFGAEAGARYDEAGWREQWTATLGGVTLASDGYLPFRDNVEHAAEAGVTVIVEPGGSARTGEVAASAAAHGMTHVQTGLRLFHH